MKKLNIKYYNSLQYMHIEAHDKMYVSDFKDIIENARNYSRSNMQLKVLLDLRNISIGFNRFQLSELIDPLNEVSNHYDFIRIAKITSGPFETALGMLLIKKIEKLSNIELKIFSTTTAALSWLNISEIKEVLK